MKHDLFKVLTIISSMCVLASCQRSSGDVWEDTKTAGRHVSRGVRSIGGKHGDSRQVTCRDDFFCQEDEVSRCDLGFIPLEDGDRLQEVAMNDTVLQPRESPGDPNSSIPGIESFRDPQSVSELASVFHTIYFDFNSNLVKGDDNLHMLRRMADYMKSHPRTYVFIEGHCDQRGPEAYNLALGARRSNSIRNFLLKEGVHPDTVFTISYGKERPAIFVDNESAWSRNRRAEFKVYQR